MVQIDHWFAPGYSATGLPHLLDEIIRLKEVGTPYLRVTRADNDGHFAQTLYHPEDRKWLVEARNGTDASHVAAELATANEVLAAITAWYREEDLPDHAWKTADLG